MTRLGNSVSRVLPLLAHADLSSRQTVAELLAETHARRSLDLSDLDAAAQAELIASRAVQVLPDATALSERITVAQREVRQLIVKFGIDPTSPDVHLGHAVPMIVLSRFQRMGHHVVFIVGDVTAKIGDPSGRSEDRTPITDAQIAENLLTYRQQVSPFLDFTSAEFRHNSQWLVRINLPQLIETLAKIPVSTALQRDDFRARLASGGGVAMSEFIYSVVMALDSVEVRADVELGAVDQLLNMQMGRRVMENSNQVPQLVVTMPLVEGIDGSGHKMSKSKGNYIALTAEPSDMFGKVMSIPDRLMVSYFRGWTEWIDDEIEQVSSRVAAQTLHPMDLKRILAGEVVASIHGVSAAMTARDSFTAQFSRHTFKHVDSLPTISVDTSGSKPLGTILTETLQFAQSMSAVRRLARQDGLRIVFEGPSGQNAVVLGAETATQSLRDVLIDARASADAVGDDLSIYLKVGRKIARIEMP